MEVVLLDTAGAILTKPWYSHNNSQLWNQMSFDLSPWRGQTVQLYFNVYNDGVGGTAAMFLDDVSLTTCTGGVTVVPTGGVTLVPTATLHRDAVPDRDAERHTGACMRQRDRQRRLHERSGLLAAGGRSSRCRPGDKPGAQHPLGDPTWIAGPKFERPGFDTPNGDGARRVLPGNTGRRGCTP